MIRSKAGTLAKAWQPLLSDEPTYYSATWARNKWRRGHHSYCLDSAPNSLNRKALCGAVLSICSVSKRHATPCACPLRILLPLVDEPPNKFRLNLGMHPATLIATQTDAGMLQGSNVEGIDRMAHGLVVASDLPTVQSGDTLAASAGKGIVKLMKNRLRHLSLEES
jgi:hypothetical protein